jgi:DNA-directed RNA polymerase subunit RPC12/RpoP
MSRQYLVIACPIDDCDREVVWIVDDDEDWGIACPGCGKQYKLTIKSDGSIGDDLDE